ncbi:MAG: 16S rRNA (guanine(527)-N(7))-methyltransferase RsmG [Clostridia bacterium]
MKNRIDFKDKLKEEAKKINIELNKDMLEKFEMYKSMLVEWNEKINLTTITEDYEIIMKHFIDCLESIKYFKNGQKVIDVGTGAGLPGVVIAIYFEGKIEVTLIDSLNKRILFLNEVIKNLKLKNVITIHARAEELANNIKYREKYDIAVSRAVANVSVLLELDTPYIKVGGNCLMLKSEKLEIELSEAKKAFNILNCKINYIYNYTYKIGEEEFVRNILIIEKKRSTPSKYPRSFAKIKKEQL